MEVWREEGRMEPGIKVLFLAAEAEPFVKVGGLGDVTGSLPAALQALVISSPEDVPDIDIRLAIPFHGSIQRDLFSFETLFQVEVHSQNGPVQAKVLKTILNGLTVYLIAGELFPDDAPVYSGDNRIDGRKYAFFSLAALEMARAMNWMPDILHANDWHTAPAIYKIWLQKKLGTYEYNTATLLGLHNLPYLGTGAEKALAEFELPPATQSGLPGWATHLPLPLGLMSADHIVAVSPHYAHEIQTPKFSSGLHRFLKRRSESISGILNGIDINRWDPARDAILPTSYDRHHIEKRLENKLALQQEFGLEANPEIPLLAIVSRMDPQKGIDLVPPALRQLAHYPWQIIILGTGDRQVEAAALGFQAEYPGRTRTVLRFDADLSHRIYAGADILLIPSRYEPSGLTQMIAMRYGCVPLARDTGGLSDTIQDVQKSPQGNGFLFHKPSPTALAVALRRALKAYRDRAGWTDMQVRGMEKDFSWERSARQYAQLYCQLINRDGREHVSQHVPQFVGNHECG
jgi:starch synthase